jgi:hypothetical protein
MQDISGYGIEWVLKASRTFPAGILLTQFADDSDPVDVPSMQIADAAMSVNGEMVSWTTAHIIELSFGMIPESDDDANLSILLENNRASINRSPARDVVTLIGYYPNGAIVTLSPGKITDGPSITSIASSGRMKSKVYKFKFEDAVVS